MPNGEIVRKDRSQYLIKATVDGSERIVISGTHVITPEGIADYVQRTRGGGGGGGTSNYLYLSNKPKINGIELVNNKTLDELGIQAKLTNADGGFGQRIFAIEQNYISKYDYQEIEGYKLFRGGFCALGQFTIDDPTSTDRNSGINIIYENGGRLRLSGPYDNCWLSNLRDPEEAADAANKSYVDRTVSKIPVEKGEAYGSIIAKDDTNHAYGKDSVSLGHSTIAGNSNKIITDPEDTKRGDEDAGYGAFVSGLSNTASGRASYSEGEGNTAIGAQSHAEGNHTKAIGKAAHAEGNYTTASGVHSHSEGSITKALGEISHAEGSTTTASGTYSHAEGRGTEASGERSHAEGSDTMSSGSCAHAEGSLTKASGDYSHAEGRNTQTLNIGEHAEGKHNLSIEGKTIHTVGIGTTNNKKNAHEIHLDGSHYIIGVGDYDGTNSKTEGVKTLQEVITSLDKSVDQAVTTANAYTDKALKEHVVIFNGNNDRSEIIEAISNNVPIVAKFSGGSSIGGMTIDSAQTAVATTFCDDGDTIELRFVLKNDSYEYFQVCYTLYPNAEKWIEDADVLATKDDLANKAEVFILSRDSSLEEVRNAYNKGYLIATYWQHVDKGTNVILFASSVMLDNDLGLEDFRPTILFNLIEDNGYVTEIYFKWLYDEQYWQDEWNQYKIPKSNEVVNLTGYQTITGEKKFSGGINMNGTSIRKLATPVNNDDAANKAYVDGVVSIKADIVDISNYLEDGAVLPYPAAYRYGLNIPHFVSFRYYESDKEDWYIAFCMTHILPEPAVGYEFIFYKRDKTDNQYKFFKRVDAPDATNEKWYNIGKKVFNEDLRDGKQDKLTDTQIANINAVPNKVNLVEISGINNENSAGMSFPFPAMYSYYGGTLPHAAQFTYNGNNYVVLCLWHDSAGQPAASKYALFKRPDTIPAHIEFVRLVGVDDEFFTICQKQFHDDLPAEVTTLKTRIAELEEGGDKWELIEEITLEEETTQIIRTKEPDGTLYDFKALMVHIANGGGANFGYSVRTVIYNNNAEILPVLTHATNAGVARVSFYKRNGYWEGVGYYVNVNGVSYYTSGTERLNSTTEKKSITKLTQTIAASNPFKVGTVIKIFAIR